MSLYDRKTDPALENDGVRFEHMETRTEGFAYTVKRAHSGNKKYSRAMQNALKPYRRQMDADEADDALIRGPLVAVYCDLMLTRWETCQDGVWAEGIENEEGGELLPANRDNLYKMLMDLPEIFDQIREDSTKAAFYRVTHREEDAKNS
jgi:hypothetical protein